MGRLIFTFIILAIFSISNGLVLAQSISITTISPDSPSHLNFDQQVSVTFEYAIDEAGGARVFVRPISSGSLTPNYAASGSPVYKGVGKETVNFTIRSGEVTVDQLRIQVLSENQNQLLFEFYLPVEFTFSSPKQTLVYPHILNQKSLKVLQKFDANAATDTSTTERTIVKQLVKEDGTIETHYSDGTIWGHTPSDETYFVDPATGDTTFTVLMKYEVQEASQPAAPPGSVATTYSEVDSDWLKSLNAWLEYLAQHQLNKIEGLLKDENSFRNYKTFEQDSVTTLYEKINLRYTFLEKLYMNNF